MHSSIRDTAALASLLTAYQESRGSLTARRPQWTWNQSLAMARDWLSLLFESEPVANQRIPALGGAFEE